MRFLSLAAQRFARSRNKRPDSLREIGRSCHVERSETSLAVGSVGLYKEITEILRFAQNDNPQEA
jgi:hypothetical protein